MLTAQEILNASILIVDDQPSNVQLLEQLLQGAGYTQVSATMAPSEVAALHRQHHYDLILLDLQMPDMDGFAVIEALKAAAQDDYLPVIVLTAQPGHKLRALQAGAKDFISKPFDLLEVKTRIHNMLEVRLLYKRLATFNTLLEQTVAERTAELRESEARFRSLTELASDWYWEQDEKGCFTRVSGPVLEMLGIQVDPLQLNGIALGNVVGSVAAHNGHARQSPKDLDAALQTDCWDETERETLRATIAARQPFIDFVFHRVNADGSQQQYRVSGEPMFNQSSQFLGYRGIGVEVLNA